VPAAGRPPPVSWSREAAAPRARGPATIVRIGEQLTSRCRYLSVAARSLECFHRNVTGGAPKRRRAMGVVMSDLIRNQLYRPSVVLPMVALMQVMVSQDFNLGQVGWVVAARGAQAALQRSRELICAVHCHE